MKRMGEIVIMGLVSAVLWVQPALAGEEAPTSAEPRCPVMAEDAANLAVSVPTDDGPVYFCCPKCIKKYTDEPAKYSAGVAAQRKVLADRPKVQVACPIEGAAVDSKVFSEKDGQKIYFCSKDCQAKYEAKPAEYAKNLANSYTYQTKCPISGDDIDPQAFMTTGNGQKIYFCCPKCAKGLTAEPAKYLPKLAEQGYSFEPADLTGTKEESGHGQQGQNHEGHGHHDH